IVPIDFEDQLQSLSQVVIVLDHQNRRHRLPLGIDRMTDLSQTACEEIRFGANLMRGSYVRIVSIRSTPCEAAANEASLARIEQGSRRADGRRVQSRAEPEAGDHEGVPCAGLEGQEQHE